jgi:hypothetical protein
MSKNRIAWFDGDLLFVIRFGTTTNSKIAAAGERVVQTYTFSRSQYDLVAKAAAAATRQAKGVSQFTHFVRGLFGLFTLRLGAARHDKKAKRQGGKVTPQQFFALDGANCLDCPLSGSSGNGKCYTHKYMQFSGFLSMLRSLAKTEIPDSLGPVERATILKWCTDSYVRFGTYGEPSLLPIDLVGDMALNAKSWTGYTHQARKPWASDYKTYFMASAHSDKEAASLTGWRSFIAYDPKTTDSAAVTCPASKEAGYKSTCAKCSLCSGVAGKGRTNIKIQTH